MVSGKQEKFAPCVCWRTNFLVNQVEDMRAMGMVTREQAPRAGDGVYVLSGRLIGSVGRTAAGRFRLDREEGGSLWLRSEAIFTAEFGRVTLVCEQSGLTDYIG